MLRNSFLHLPGIGALKERALWAAGVRDWDDYERNFLAQRQLFENHDSNGLAGALEASRRALESADFDFFGAKLPQREHYRVALTVPERTVFLDIETTGLSFFYDEITLVGISTAEGYRCFIKGSDPRDLFEILAESKCLVTFNGAMFDLKFLRKEFERLPLPKSHVDLRFLARSVGFSGGQKTVERALGVERFKEIRGMRGERAPLLWHEYRLGDVNAAKTLIEYNHADVDGMRVIFDEVVARIAAAAGWKVPGNAKFDSRSATLTWVEREPDAGPNRVYIPAFRGKRGPQITYRQLVVKSRERPLRIVGIDLTGSAKRPSGWCLLVGNEAHTKTLRSDRQILRHTLEANPDVVSIDSPLSLPRGRRRVTDDDPGRSQFGILRQCERTLMQRGVKVYPSLIKSMQALTARGIRLARTLRTQGIPVIESYPGAAQDIMGIPRKRAGLDYLKKGLADFGVRGSFLHDKVSHDEVDAVTSSIVGLFFWSGRFEALGNEEEDYLIIPDLKRSSRRWLSRRVVGLSGPIAAGKTTAARLLEKRGFAYGRFSQVLADLLTAEGKPVNRETLQRIGERVHRTPGQRWLNRKLVTSLPADMDLAIDGLRWPEDHATLIEAYGPSFCHVNVDATVAHRRSRYVKTGSPRREFVIAAQHPVEQKVAALAGMAHAKILNDGSLRAFTAKVIRVIMRSNKK
jgi:uncharacterized protein YprB with RNaseH-like and TPR domain/predicted nuclease with RNAse H fold/dephospho-CoA kinase